MEHTYKEYMMISIANGMLCTYLFLLAFKKIGVFNDLLPEIIILLISGLFLKYCVSLKYYFQNIFSRILYVNLWFKWRKQWWNYLFNYYFLQKAQWHLQSFCLHSFFLFNDMTIFSFFDFHNTSENSSICVTKLFHITCNNRENYSLSIKVQDSSRNSHVKLFFSTFWFYLTFFWFSSIFFLCFHFITLNFRLFNNHFYF